MVTIFAKFLLLILGFSLLSAQADCLRNYSYYRINSITGLVTAPARGAAYSTAGAASSSGALTVGTFLLDTDLSTAGILYGAAFAYEGHSFTGMAIDRIALYKSRAKAHSLIKEAYVGTGTNIEEFTEDLNERLLVPELTVELVASFVRDGNEERTFCPEDREIFTAKNIADYVFDRLKD